MTSLAEALRTVPRVDAAQWERLGAVTRWAIAARAAVLPMTLLSAVSGGLLALPHPDVDPWLWAIATLGLLAAHATNNLLNDYIDSARGVDSGEYERTRYATHVLQDGLLDRTAMRRYIALTAVVALGAGAALLWLRGGHVAALMLAGSVLVLFYTWPLKYMGLGEPAVWLAWGPLMIAGTHYVACGEWSGAAVAFGAVYGLGPTLVLIGKHIDKLAADAVRGIRTLPVLLGERRARALARGLIALQYAGTIVLVAGPWFTAPLLLVLAGAPAALRFAAVLRSARPATAPVGEQARLWPLWFAPQAFALNRRFGSLLLAGLLLHVGSRALGLPGD